jgi:drug/metabolite transporter (DMT)-like permease
MNISLKKLDLRKVNKNIIFLLTFFLIAFPKGGFKISNIPITFGYLFLAIVAILFFLRNKYEVLKEHILVLIFFLPFQIISFLTLIFNGYEKTSFSFGFVVSFFVSFFILPFYFFFIFSEHIKKLDLKYFFKILKRFILFIAIYGIFLFFYKIFTKKFLEIIFLSINYHDKGFLEYKHINRGAVFKLISTYNNGNIYGISLLMLYPLYKLIEKKFYKKLIVASSLILTLSRTVWIGFLLTEFFYDFFIKKDKKKACINFLMTLFLMIIFLIIIGKILNFSFFWFFDFTLNGRVLQFETFKNLEIFSTNIFWAIKEILYLSILENFSVLGFITFLIAMSSPLIIYKIKNSSQKKLNIDKSIFFGLFTYLIISISDAAILYIPIMAIYLFLSSLLLTNKVFDLEA